MRVLQIFKRRRRGCGHAPEARQHYRKGSDCALCAAAFDQIIAVSYPERGRGGMIDGVPVVEPEQP